MVKRLLSEIDKTLAENIKKQRELHGLTRAQLEEKAGLSDGILAQIETFHKVIGKSVVTRIAEALNLSELTFYKSGSYYSPYPASLVGANIKRLREMLGWSKSHFAELLETQLSDVDSFEAGQMIDDQMIKELASIFNVNVSEFFAPVLYKNRPSTSSGEVAEPHEPYNATGIRTDEDSEYVKKLLTILHDTDEAAKDSVKGVINMALRSKAYKESEKGENKAVAA